MQQNGGDTPYIGATMFNNGITGYIDVTPSQEGNTITVANNGNDGTSFYHSYPFSTSSDVSTLTAKTGEWMNKYTGLYLCCLIRQEGHKYSYGMKFSTGRLKETELPLPSTKGNDPDWPFIIKYMQGQELGII